MRIAVDIDDTLNAVDRVRYAGEYIRRKGLPFRLVNADAHTLVDVFDWQLSDVLTFVREGGGITAFTDAPARKGAREAVTAWRAAGHEVIVLTSRVAEWFSNPEKLSRDWLEKRRIPYDGLVASVADKGAYCVQSGIDVLVDDSLAQCLSAQMRGVYAVLAVSRLTLPRAHEVRYGGANWRQIDEAVRHIAGLLARRG